MNPNTADVFVGAVAMVLGVYLAYAAAMNTDHFSRFWLSRRMAESWGQTPAQWLCGFGGLLITLLGLMLITGILPIGSGRDSTGSTDSERVANSMGVGATPGLAPPI